MVVTGLAFALVSAHLLGRLAGHADARRSIDAAIVTHRARRLQAELDGGSASDKGAATSIGHLLKACDVQALAAVLREEETS